jgi:D-alanyl-D-alanine carboxypeptidase
MVPTVSHAVLSLPWSFAEETNTRRQTQSIFAMAQLALLLAAASQLASCAPTSSPCPPTRCPAWFDDIGPQWIADAPDIPGVQLTVKSAKCARLHCKGVWNNPAFTDYPPLTIDTPNRLASVTKTFTSLSVLKLVEDGIVDINGSVTNYIPDWAVATLDKRMRGGADEARQITPWMLLHHRSGLGNSAGNKWLEFILTNPLGVISLRETLEWYAENAPASAAPGVDFRYADTGYVYLGLMVEHMRGTTMAAAARKAARMDELGMTSTYWEVYEEPPPGAPPHGPNYAGDIDATSFNGTWFNYGGTGLVSTAEDLVKYAKALHTGQLLGPEGMEAIYTTVPNDGRFDGIGYGSGWSHDFQFGHHVWYHRGAFGTWLYYLPEIDLAISGAVNQMNQEPFVPNYVLPIIQNVVEEGLC